MDWIMNNLNANEQINLCSTELERIKHIIIGIGKTSHPVPFLTKYAIIKSCGTIESCFKTIIADYRVHEQNEQIRNFVDGKFRKSSINPSKENIHSTLKLFSESWNIKFKEEIDSLPDKNKVLDSLKSLNEARNTFAHGGNPSASFDNVIEYFNDSVRILKIIDDIVV
jgi:hypothetical protein